MPDVNNLIQGVGYLYIADVGTVEPADGDVGDPPGAGWDNLGFTHDGVTLTISQEYSELEVDQVADIPGRRLVKREVTVATSLAEATLENFTNALNGGTITEDGVAGFKNYEPDADPIGSANYFMTLFDGFAPGGLMRRFIVRRVLQVGDVESASAKDGQTVFPVEFHGHYVSASVTPYKIVDEIAAA